MRSNTFASIYSANDINKIRMTDCCPAKALIEDLLSREIPLKVLLRVLFKIGMKKCSFSILERQKPKLLTHGPSMAKYQGQGSIVFISRSGLDPASTVKSQKKTEKKDKT